MMEFLQGVVQNTPPVVAWALGFYMALSLRQGRLAVIINKMIPMDEGQNEKVSR